MALYVDFRVFCHRSLQFTEVRNLLCCHVCGAMTLLKCPVKMPPLSFGFWDLRPRMCRIHRFRSETCVKITREVRVHNANVKHVRTYCCMFMPFWQRSRPHSSDAHAYHFLCHCTDSYLLELTNLWVASSVRYL